MFGFEAGIHAEQLSEAFNHETRACEKQQGKSDFAPHQPGAHGIALKALGAPPARAQRFARSDFRQSQTGGKTAEQAGGDGDTKRESENPAIEPEIRKSRFGARGEE